MLTQSSSPIVIQTKKGAAILLGPKLKKTSDVSLLSHLLHGTPEACSRCPRPLCKPTTQEYHVVNTFVAAVHEAFAAHFPIQLSPDAMWLCITQGFAIHVKQNAERLRHVFVEHQGKEEIIVRRDNFVKGNPSNDWESVFSDFSSQIESNIGTPLHSLLVNNFSTTGRIEKAVSEIVLMDSMQKYFDYSVWTLCGIPAFHLSGTSADWQQLREKAKQLVSLDKEQLASWGIALDLVFEEILKAFVHSSSADAQNDLFWDSFYKFNHASGGSVVTGWINVLFPYLQQGNGQYEVNPISLSPWNSQDRFWGIKPNLFPCGLSKAPFVWKYLGSSISMEFVGGIIGWSQEGEGLVLVPEFGWAVLEKMKGA